MQNRRNSGQTQVEMPHLLGVIELAERLGCPKSWVYANRDVLPPAHRLGRGLRWSERDLAQWLDTRREGAE